MALLRVDVEALGLLALPGTAAMATRPAIGRRIQPCGLRGRQGMADELGRRYQQNVIVWAGAPAVPELVMLR